MIVAHALDDLEADRVDLPTALTLTALAGWQECERTTGRFGDPISSPRSPLREETFAPRDAL